MKTMALCLTLALLATSALASNVSTQEKPDHSTNTVEGKDEPAQTKTAAAIAQAAQAEPQAKADHAGEQTQTDPQKKPVHWGYSGAGGPAAWGSLRAEYAACGEGLNQSPINIQGAIEATLPPIVFNYPSGGQAVTNNGHTIKVDVAPGSSIQISGRYFELIQFHFHTPSENTIEGQSYPMEVHLVHSDTKGNLAVIGVMFETGGWNKVVDAVWKKMPAKVGQTVKLDVPVSATGLLPGLKDYYRFNGSLTTPPCTEGVWWMVMKKPIIASQQQIDQFTQVMGGATNRPVQPVNARPVLQ